ncbi:hypothetical protein L1887_08107 [Cichorium endivia]|nr:hypothetical protein L1887_08107 [Cichorium endivia]
MDPEEPNNRSSSASNLTRESTFRSLSSPTQSPPIQLMERADDYEFEDVRNSPVFSNRCSSSSSEWSSLSNESLFSIHITNSLTHDPDGFQSGGESMKSDDLMIFSSLTEPESDLDTLKLETNVPMYNLDEPQKVVRWKTQVEHLAEEGAPHQWQPSPFTDHKSNEPVNHTTSKPNNLTFISERRFGGHDADVETGRVAEKSSYGSKWAQEAFEKGVLETEFYLLSFMVMFLPLLHGNKSTKLAVVLKLDYHSFSSIDDDNDDDMAG